MPISGITDKEERQRYLDLAEDAGLDIALITKKVVENIRSKSDIDFTNLHNIQASVDTGISEVRFHLDAFIFCFLNGFSTISPMLF